MELFAFLSEKLDINLNLHKTLIELEHLDKKWVMKSVPLEEHLYGRIPGEKDIRMWSIPRSSMKLIVMLALLNKSKIIIDVGTSAGYSAIWLSLAAYFNKGKVYTIEIFKPKIKLAKKYIKKSGMEKYIELIEGDAGEILEKWNGEKIDFILFDADKQNHVKYLKIIENKLSKNAIIVADNASNFRGIMNDYLSYLDKSERYIHYWLDYENGLSIAIKI
jgi:predicted O-methyltransferase YrrM